MGIRIGSSATYKTPVKFTILDQNGKPEKQSFIAEFKRMDKPEVKALIDNFDSDTEMCREVLAGWSMQNLDTLEDVPFNPQTLESILNIAGLAGVIVLRFLETVNASREKN